MPTVVKSRKSRRVRRAQGDRTPRHATFDGLIAAAGQTSQVRWYDSTVGRWLSEDPAEVGQNLYEYCGNGPTDGTDPSGLTISSHCDIVDYLKDYVKGMRCTEDKYFVYHDAQRKKDSIDAQIIDAMINSSFDFRVKGDKPSECLENIKKNIAARALIVKCTEEKKYGFGAGKKFHEEFTTPATAYETNPLDYFNSINNQKSVIGCSWATTVTFYAGLGNWGEDSAFPETSYDKRRRAWRLGPYTQRR